MKSLSLRILSEKLRFSCFSQVPTGSDYPSFRPILPKIYLILIFHSPYSSITSMLKLSNGISSIKESSINTVLLLCLNSSIRAGSQMGTAKSRCWQISSKALKTFSVLLPGPSCRETQEANILLSFLRVPLIRNIKTPLNIFSLYGNRKINKSFEYSFSKEIKQSPKLYFHKAKNINSYESIFLKEEWSDIS